MSIGIMTSSCSMTQVFIFELTTCPEIKGFHGDIIIIIIKNFVRSITDSWNAVSAFPLNYEGAV